MTDKITMDNIKRAIQKREEEIKASLCKSKFQDQIDNAKELLIESEKYYGPITAKYACELLDNLTCCEG